MGNDSDDRLRQKLEEEEARRALGLEPTADPYAHDSAVRSSGPNIEILDQEDRLLITIRGKDSQKTIQTLGSAIARQGIQPRPIASTASDGTTFTITITLDNIEQVGNAIDTAGLTDECVTAVSAIIEYLEQQDVRRFVGSVPAHHGPTDGMTEEERAAHRDRVFAEADGRVVPAMEVTRISDTALSITNPTNSFREAAQRLAERRGLLITKDGDTLKVLAPNEEKIAALGELSKALSALGRGGI